MESGTSRTTAPIAVSSSSSETGRLILNGQIKDNVLTFTPRLDTLTARQQGTSGTSSADFGRGLSCTDFGEAEPVSIPMQNGAEVSATYQYPAEGATATVVWRLKGTRVEVWQVRIENSHRHTTGVQPKVGAGVSVQWRVDTRIEIENGNWKSGVTTVSIVQVDSISDPAGVFTISHKTSVSPPYQVNGEKHGNEVHLRFPRSNTSSYRIDYDYKLTGGDLVPVLTAAGVANAASVLATLQKAGTMTDGTTELVPDKNTVYMLPLTDGAVLTSEYGETIAVTRLQ